MSKLQDVQRDFGFLTRSLHAGFDSDPVTKARAVPIYQTSSYVFDDSADAAALFGLQKFGNILYAHHESDDGRAGKARGVAGGRSCGAGGWIGPGGAACRHHEPDGGRATIWLRRRPYMAGTYTQFDVSFRRFGIEVTFVDPDDPENFRKALKPNTKAIYGETISNPRGNVLDLAAVAKIAAEANVPFIVDNTFATPYLCRPFEHGANIVLHSLTKFLGGQGSSIGGVIVDGGKFDWKASRPSAVESTLAGLPRHELRRDLRQPRFYPESACGRSAGPRSGAESLQLVSVYPGRRDAGFAHGPARRERAGGRRVAGATRPGELGEISRSEVESVSCVGAEIPAQGRRRDLQLWHQGRL